MRAYELFETTEDDITLLKIAREAAPAIKKAFIWYTTHDYEHLIDAEFEDDIDIQKYAGGAKIGTIGELTGLHGKGVYDQLLRVGVKLYYNDGSEDPFASPASGAWHHDANMIYLNCFSFKEDANIVEFKNLMSTFLHEMRHALDDFTSGKNLSLQKTYHIPYMDQTGEKNARYQQAIEVILNELEKYHGAVDSQTMIKLIKTSFAKHHLPLDKRLMTRAYHYITRYIETAPEDFPDMIRYHPYPENNNENK